MTLYDAKQFSVDSHGAYVTKLTDSAGSPILFERTEIEGKRRGGSHVCLPYFGADAAGKLPQHGFGRDVEWEVEMLGDNEISCVYKEMEGDLPTGFEARLLYSIDETGDSFITALSIFNVFKSKGPFYVSPGFHPYFAVDPNDVRLNGVRVNLTDFEPYKDFPDTESLIIESRGRTISISSYNLHHMVAWTDLKGGYFCIEPTHSGHSFNSISPDGDLLQTSETVSYSYTISWT